MTDTDARWLAPGTVVSLTAWPGAAASLAERVRGAFGLELAASGRWTEAGDLVCIRLGPDHWQIERAGTHDLARDLTTAAGPDAGIIDISDARVVLRLSGPASPEILACLLPLDLHPRAFAPHHAASTVAAHITVQFRQIDTIPTYDIACLRSYADSLRRAVAQAGGRRIRIA